MVGRVSIFSAYGIPLRVGGNVTRRPARVWRQVIGCGSPSSATLVIGPGK